ncbi:hypothetical protein ATL39_0903 [Sinobaca qinghaiensis]|uniref:Uncharacterized protein n=1 Tax=Sinobaca qinghaiensis TaxID=342944 RepID=A0A419V5E5_9BACL|nr:hypothetical protein [Sinobaca qinghaiensis]RKD75205.1 hypothetical protein ATL39_0903 [Sinobaca qinghaiensis]
MLFTDQLIEEYRENKKSLQQLTNTYNSTDPQDKEDKSKVNSMIESMAFAIEWMEIGDSRSYSEESINRAPISKYSWRRRIWSLT